MYSIIERVSHSPRQKKKPEKWTNRLVKSTIFLTTLLALNACEDPSKGCKCDVVSNDTNEKFYYPYDCNKSQLKSCLESNNLHYSGKIPLYATNNVMPVFFDKDRINNTKPDAPHFKEKINFISQKIEKKQENEIINDLQANIYFKTSEHTLTSEDIEDIKKFGQYLTENQVQEITLYGHTDNIGKHEDNLILAEKRNKSVKKVLEKTGLKVNYITKGESDLKHTQEVSEPTERRVEIHGNDPVSIALIKTKPNIVLLDNSSSMDANLAIFRNYPARPDAQVFVFNNRYTYFGAELIEFNKENTTEAAGKTPLKNSIMDILRHIEKYRDKYPPKITMSIVTDGGDSHPHYVTNKKLRELLKEINGIRINYIQVGNMSLGNLCNKGISTACIVPEIIKETGGEIYTISQ